MYALTIAPLRCDTSVNLGMKQATYFLLFEKKQWTWGFFDSPSDIQNSDKVDDVDSQDKNGDTFLMIAARIKNQNNVTMICYSLLFVEEKKFAHPQKWLLHVLSFLAWVLINTLNQKSYLWKKNYCFEINHFVIFDESQERANWSGQHSSSTQRICQHWGSNSKMYFIINRKAFTSKEFLLLNEFGFFNRSKLLKQVYCDSSLDNSCVEAIETSFGS